MTEPTLRTSAEMLDRMEALLRRMASVKLSISATNAVGKGHMLMYAPVDHYADAQAIVAMLPEPVDPLLQVARDLVADIVQWHDPHSPTADRIRCGKLDDRGPIKRTLLALRGSESYWGVDEDKSIDSDIQMARDIAADACADAGCATDFVNFMRGGSYDDSHREVSCALAGIKRGRELASA